MENRASQLRSKRGLLRASDRRRRASVALCALLWLAPDAYAGCDVTPSVSDQFRGFLGEISPPALVPGQTAQVFARPAVCLNPTRSAAADFAVPSGCTLGGGPCTQLPADDFAVNLIYRPADPAAPHNILVLRSDCTGFGGPNACGALPGGGTVRCIDRSAVDPAQFSIETVQLGSGASERRMNFVVPDTTGLFGPGQLAGPAAVAVTRTSDPLPCGLASNSCKTFFGSSPLVTCADTLYLNDSTCTTDAASVDPVGVAVTALPRANVFADLCPVGEASVCKFQGPGAPPIQATQDAAGNVLVPVDFLGFSGNPNFATLLQGGLQIGGVPIRIPNGDFVETRSLRNFAPVVPVFEVSPVPGSEGVVQGTLDARFIVYRLFDHACAENDQIPCSVDSECSTTCNRTQVAAAAAALPSPAGSGPVIGTCADPKGNPACRVLDSFLDVGGVSQGAENNRARAFTTNECAGQLANPPLTMSVNAELAPDLLDQVLVLRDGESNLSVQKPAPGAFDGLAVTRIQEPPFEFGSEAVAGDIAAWLTPELGSCFGGPALCDRTGNGVVFDNLLEAFQLAAPGSQTAIDLLEGATLVAGAVPTNAPGGSVPLRTDLARLEGEHLVIGAEPGRNVGSASTQVSNQLIFFLASPFAHLPRRIDLVNADGEGGASAAPAKETRISPDGGFATFTSAASDLGPVGSGTEQVFLKNLATGAVLRVSEPNCAQQDAQQTSPNGQSGGGVPSRDGRYVAFWSFAANLVPGDTNGRADVFVRDTTSCDLVRVSVDSAGNQGNDVSLNPWISADGRKVVFESRATNLDPAIADTNGSFDVFLHDRDPNGLGFDREATTAAISVAASQPAAGNGTSNQAVVSGDGGHLALATAASNLVPGDTNGQVDVVAGTAGALALASTDSAGASGALSSLKPRISDDGRYVSFVSDAALVPEDTNGRRDAYVKDLVTGQIRRAGDFRGAPECRESIPGLAQFVPDPNGITQDAALSPDGELLVYATTSTDLVPNDPSATSDIVVEDLRTGQTALVSASPDGSSPGNGSSSLPSIGNGVIGFQSLAQNLGPLSVSPVNAFASRPANGSLDLRPRLGILDARDRTVRILDLPAEHVKARNGVAIVAAAGETAKIVRQTCGGVVGGATCDASCNSSCAFVVEDLLHVGLSEQDAISIDDHFACALPTDILAGGVPVAACHPIGPLGPLVPVSGIANVPAASVQVQNGKLAVLSAKTDGPALYDADLGAGGAARRVQAADKAVLGDQIACFTTFRRDIDRGCQGSACDQKQMFITVPGQNLPPVACAQTEQDCNQRSCFPALPFSVNEPSTCKFITPAEIDVPDCLAQGLDLNADGKCTLLVARCTLAGSTASLAVGDPVDPHSTANPVLPQAPGGGGSTTGITGVCYPLVNGAPDLSQPNGPCPCGPFESCVNDGQTAVTTLAPDSDGDGIPDQSDSCPHTPNSGIDFDEDGVDDACDGFVCGDGKIQRAEVCDDGSANGGPASSCGADCVPAVQIDVRPPFKENPVIKDSPLAIGVAILGSKLLRPDRDLDKHSLVFAASVAGQPCVTDPSKGATPLDFDIPWDVNGDGFLDEVVFFPIRDARFQLDSKQACLTGTFVREIGQFGHETFAARDQVHVISNGCGLGAEIVLALAPLLWLRRRCGSARRDRSGGHPL